MTVLSERFTQAVDYARVAHAKQTRKGGRIPYLYHLLGVASIALQYGGNEDQCIAALLHDAVEDCGAEHEARIRKQFGARVASLVMACTDSTAESKAKVGERKSWLARKQAYVAALRHKPAAARFVSACDKLHNAQAIVGDMEKLVGQGRKPEGVFTRFNAPPTHVLAYYHAMAKGLGPLPNGLDRALQREVRRMQELSSGLLVQDLSRL